MTYLAAGDLPVLFFISLVIFVALRQIQRYTLLRHVPGPPAAGFTDLWLFFRLWRGDSIKELTTKLHQKYGPVLRLGPKRLTFADPAAVPIIFGTTHPLEKAPSYDTLLVISGGREVSSFITIRDEHRVSAMKKQLSSAFTASAMLQQEPEIDTTIENLMQHLKKAGQTIDMAPWLAYWAFDTLSRIAFSEDQSFMSHQEDLGSTLAGARDRFAHWHLWFSVPRLERLLFKNRYAQKLVKPSMLAKLAVQKIADRRAKSSLDEERNDLLGKYLTASKKAPEWFGPADLIGLTVSTIHAGADTTAVTTSLLMFNLCKHPAAQARLHEELSEATLSSPPRFLELNKLEYLDSVIRESMRLTPTASDLTERLTPPSGLSISGIWVPGGTTVSVNQHASNYDAAVWGPYPHTFDPERWLRASETQRRAMERASFGFSAGKRICLGQHLAIIEMKKVIAALVGGFEFSLANPDEGLQTHPSAITAVDRLELRLEPRRRH